MSFRFPIKNLYVLPNNSPYYLGEDSIKEEQPKQIKIQLKDHQLTSYCQIRSLENKDGFYYIKNNNNKNVMKIKDYNKYLEDLYSSNQIHNINHFRSNYWVLSDKTGYGKTLTAICSLKDKEPNIIKVNNLNEIDKYTNFSVDYFNTPYNINSKSGRNYSSFKITFDNLINDEKICSLFSINTTLIIVPFGKVFTQWCNTLDNYSSYQGIQIKNVSKILGEKLNCKKLSSITDKFEKYQNYLNYNSNMYNNNFELYFDLEQINDNEFNEIFNELQSYKENFDKMDYILIVNTFTKNLFEVYKRYYINLKNIITLSLLKRIIVDIIDFCKNNKTELNENLYKIVKTYHYNNSKNIKNEIEIILNTNNNKSLFLSKNNDVLKKVFKLVFNNVESIVYPNCHRYDMEYVFYRIIIDEADTINLKGAYSVDLVNKFQKLGLITATYSKLLFGETYSNCIVPLVINKHNSSENSFFPVILNDDNFLEKSFSMPVINRKYLICDYNEELSHFMNNSSYLEKHGLLSAEVKELLNVNDFNGALKKMGATENSNDNIIDIICKDVIRNLKNKKIEKDMIEKLDLEQNLKNTRLLNINKNIKELEEKLEDIYSKFQDISIYDKIASTFSEELLEDIDEFYNTIDTMNLPDNYIDSIKDIFNKYNIDIINNQDNINLYEKVISLVKNPNKFCGICASVYRNPVLLQCTHIFCSECISRLIKSNGGNNCPLCRKQIDFKKLCLIINEIKQETVIENKKKIVEINNLNTIFELIKNTTENIKNIGNVDTSLNGNDIQVVDKKKTNKKSKQTEEDKYKHIELFKTNRDKIESVNILLNYIQNTNPNKKVLVYSNHELIINNIKQEIDSNSLKYKTENMVGNGTEGCINRFKNKDSDLLFLNARKNAAGIELPEGTDIIIVHKMNKEIETQIIGRCMRMGRKEPLNVYYLYHNDEKYF